MHARVLLVISRVIIWNRSIIYYIWSIEYQVDHILAFVFTLHLTWVFRISGGKETQRQPPNVKITPLQKKKIFCEFLVDGRYIPRAACLDLEPGSIDSLRSSKYGGLFSPDNCICGELNRESGGRVRRKGRTESTIPKVAETGRNLGKSWWYCETD